MKYISISIEKVFCAFPSLALFIKEPGLPSEALISAAWSSDFRHMR